MESKVFPLSKAVELYGDKWDEIVAKQQLNPSVLSGWCLCLEKTFKTNAKAFVVSSEGELKGIVPFYVKSVGFGIKKTVHLVGNLVSYHQDLVSDKECGKEVFLEFIQYIKSSGFAAFEVLGIERDSNLRRLIDKNYNKRSFSEPTEASPYFNLNADWSELLAQKSRKVRYKIKNREKLITENDGFHIKLFDVYSEKLLDIIFEIEKNSWKVAEGMAITSNPLEVNYYRNLLPYLSDCKVLFCNVLYKDSNPIAYNLCYRFGDKVGQIKTSYIEESKELSPGSMIVEDCFRRLLADSKSYEFDFLGNVMPHKMIWCNEVREHDVAVVFMDNIYGRIFLSIKHVKKKLKSLLG